MFNLFKKPEKLKPLEEAIRKHDEAIKKIVDDFPKEEILARYKDLIKNYDLLLQELPVLQQRLDSILVDEFDVFKRDYFKSRIDTETLEDLKQNRDHVKKDYYDTLNSDSASYSFAHLLCLDLSKLVLKGFEFNQRLYSDASNEIKTFLEKYENQLLLELNFDS